MTRRAPEFRRGEVLTAAKLNQVSRVVNDVVLNAPRDLDTGEEEAIAPDTIPLYELGGLRTVSTVRVYQDDDEESDNFVDVERTDTLVLRNNETGESYEIILANPTE